MPTHAVPIKRIGIVGGGQLGRMMAIAAARLNFGCVILCSTPNSPAGQIADRQILGDLHDPDKIRELAKCCDVITYEIEDIDSTTLAALEKEGHEIHPSAEVLATIQDKLLQKRKLAEHGIPTAEFVEADLSPEAFAEFGYPLVQKARRGGYDGRGVSILHDSEEFSQHLPVPSLLEKFITTEKEIAVLVARGKDGSATAYPPVEMSFTDQNILDVLLSPADISEDIAQQATSLATRVVEVLNGVGIFGVEMLLTAQGELLINEVAPRTHNSGHQTIEANITDQFEQHLRAISGLPLGATEQLAPAAMINLLSEPDYTGNTRISGLEEALAINGVCVHLYGKESVKPHRKMGHITALGNTLAEAKEKAEQAHAHIRITGDEKS
ncbi:MAG: 5-(carboxyamino)imidazole ribonucleotide synthase [bacterium]